MSNKLKIVIAGSRTFNDYKLLKSVVIDYIGGMAYNNIEIVSGGANGADNLGEKLANELGCSLRIFPADWDKYGKSAGVRRNEQMAIYSDAVIVFWDGISKGTQNMIDNAKKHNCALHINLYNQTK